MGRFLVQLFTSECVPPMAGLAGPKEPPTPVCPQTFRDPDWGRGARHPLI